jgi:NaMN:DMB phosphoribosyltransferase
LPARQALRDLAEAAQHHARESSGSPGLLTGLEDCGAGNATTALATRTAVIKRARRSWPN